MGRKYPPLDRAQVETILKNLNFTIKRQEGSHVQWEGYVKGKRKLVTVDRLSSKKAKYDPKILKSMIQQSGLSKRKFYSYLYK